MEKTLWLMLWYGLVGVATNRGVYKYIYDYQYDMKRLEADLRICKEEAVYVINPSVHVALEG
jgi:hypothetical protein